MSFPQLIRDFPQSNLFLIVFYSSLNNLVDCWLLIVGC